HNWSYIGLPHSRWIRWPGYALSYATVMPGILWTTELMNNGLSGDSTSATGDPPAGVHSPGHPPSWLLPVGFAMVLLPLLWPRQFFPLIWGGVFFLAEPYVQKYGGHSLIADWRAGRWRTTVALLISGLICGAFWEFCYYWAGSK